MKKFLVILAALTLMLSAVAPMATAETKWDEEVDVLVVGAGGAGMCAAIEAKTAGAEKVLVIDKQEQLYSLTYLCQGILSGYETQLAKKHDVHQTAEDCYEQMMRTGKWQTDPELTWITAKECGNLIDWLIDEVNVPFKDTCERNPGYGPLPLIHYVEGKGAGLRQPFIDKLAALNIDFRMQHKAVKLLGNEDHSEVIGAVIETPDGVKNIKADAVVLCTGGYGDSPEMIGRMAPGNEYMITMRAGGPSTGDGIIMASEFGAMMQSLDRVLYGGGDYNNSPYRMSGTIYVDAEGARFKDEKGHSYMSKDSYRTAMQKHDVDYYWILTDAAAAAANENDAKAVAKNKGIVSGETLAELAEKTGMNAEVLEATVAAWNTACDTNEDKEFGRERSMVKVEKGPFYAMKSACRVGFTYGGIARNKVGEVLNYRGEAIPGLYVGGEAAAAACANGWTMSHAMTWGRIAGKSAAAYALAK